MGAPARQTARPGLDRNRVVATAQQIARRDGMAAVTMSGVARALGVTPMALYRHVKDVDELVDLVIEAVNAEIVLPDPAPGEQRLVQFVSVLRSMYDHYGQYRGLAEVLLNRGAAATSGGVRLADWFLRSYLDLGLDSRRAAVSYATFREFFLVSLIQRRRSVAPHRENSRSEDLLRRIDNVTAEERFDLAVEMFLRWVQDSSTSGH